jgi:hypothetical protein
MLIQAKGIIPAIKLCAIKANKCSDLESKNECLSLASSIIDAIFRVVNKLELDNSRITQLTKNYMNKLSVET